MIDGFTIALLMAEFGQVWAKLGLRESRTTLGDITGPVPSKLNLR